MTPAASRSGARELDPPSVAVPDGPFSQAVVTGGFVFVSGQASVARDGSVVGKGDVRAQTRQTLHNVRQIVEAAGSDLGHVVKLVWYLVDVADRAAVAEVRREFWAARFPASTLIEISRLAHQDLLVEVDVIAELPTGTQS